MTCPICREEFDIPGAIFVGDRIRISVALLRQIYDRPDHETAIVELVTTVEQADGVKILHLRKL